MFTSVDGDFVFATVSSGFFVVAAAAVVDAPTDTISFSAQRTENFAPNS